MNTSHHRRLADPPLRVNMKRHITNYDGGILPYKHKFTILLDECRFHRVWHPGAVSGMGGRRIAIGAVSLPGLQGTCSYGTMRIPQDVLDFIMLHQSDATSRIKS